VTKPTRLDLTDERVLRQIVEVQRAAYAVEAELIGFDGIPPLHESLDQLRVTDDLFLGVFDDEGLAGAVAWGRIEDGRLHIRRLVVHPRVHRCGIATALLDALDELEPTERTVVSTGTGNTPALTLYRKRGFLPFRTRPLAPGVTITDLERRTHQPEAPILKS
jgi:GNAT superfamily N-acetyltransferase